MNNDHIYWAFSAAAQSIAAFVAFLLTGFALVHTLMEAAREKDDTLEEVHAALRQKYHARLALLAWVTGLAVILSLVTVFVNRWEFPHKGWLLSVTAAVDLVAIAGGLAFVVSIVNPPKYERAARRRSSKIRKQNCASAGKPPQQRCSSKCSDILKVWFEIICGIKSCTCRAGGLLACHSHSDK